MTNLEPDAAPVHESQPHAPTVVATDGPATDDGPPSDSISDLAPEGAKAYSFGQSAHLTAEKYALYKEAATQIATDLTKVLANSLVGFNVEAGTLIEADAGHDLVDDAASFDSASVRFDHRICATVVTELPLALTLVTGMLGGAGFPPGDPRPLTPIERRVLDLLGQQFVDVAKDTLLIEEDLQLDRSRDGAFAAADSDETEARIGFTFGIESPAGGGRLILAFDLVTIQQFSDVIDARLSGRRVTAPVLANPQTASALHPVPVTFSVGMGQVGLTARQVVELRVGDVIRTRLPVDSDLVASVGEVDLYGVKLGQAGRQLTAHITSSLSPRGGDGQARTVAT